MSGHSKWATTKHKKALVDSKRSKAFSKLANNIAIAARKGKDPINNPSLRDMVDKAKALNMPKENIDRAIQRGSGEIPGVVVSEYLIEAYGPSKTALLIKTITDNKNRTLGSVRSILNEHGGRLAETGSVQWLFTETVCFEIPLALWQTNPQAALLMIDAGATDIEENNDPVIVSTNKQAAENVKAALNQSQFPVSAKIDYLPNNPITIANESEQQTIKNLIEAIDSQEDVDEVYLNVQL
jgi:YebC/PmpR family DNA-binding regulatory protein